jgi:hypothetical protein
MLYILCSYKVKLMEGVIALACSGVGCVIGSCVLH